MERKMILCFLLLLGFFLEGGIGRIGSFPEGYPGYYHWSGESQTLQLGHYQLGEDARSLQKGFLTDKPKEPFGWKAEHKEDSLVLFGVYKDMENGYFVDAGTKEWWKSNTFVAEHFNNWTGICIEPNPTYHVAILSDRKCKLVINPVAEHNGDRVPFGVHPDHSIILGNHAEGHAFPDRTEEELKRIEHIWTHTVTLTTILETLQAPSTIHYLSISIGSDPFYALQGLNWEKYKVLVVTTQKPSREAHYLLAKQGLVLLSLFTGYGHCIYIHATLPNFDKLFQKHFQPPDGLWDREEHLYLLDPRWEGNLETYIAQAKKLYDLAPFLRPQYEYLERVVQYHQSLDQKMMTHHHTHHSNHHSAPRSSSSSSHHRHQTTHG